MRTSSEPGREPRCSPPPLPGRVRLPGSVPRPLRRPGPRLRVRPFARRPRREQKGGAQVGRGQRPHQDEPPEPAAGTPASAQPAGPCPRRTGHERRLGCGPRERRSERGAPPASKRTAAGPGPGRRNTPSRSTNSDTGRVASARFSRARAVPGRPASSKDREARPASHGSASTPAPMTRAAAWRSAGRSATSSSSRIGCHHPAGQARRAAMIPQATSRPRTNELTASWGTGGRAMRRASSSRARKPPSVDAPALAPAPAASRTRPTRGSQPPSAHATTTRVDTSARTGNARREVPFPDAAASLRRSSTIRGPARHRNKTQPARPYSPAMTAQTATRGKGSGPAGGLDDLEGERATQTQDQGSAWLDQGEEKDQGGGPERRGPDDRPAQTVPDPKPGSRRPAARRLPRNARAARPVPSRRRPPVRPPRGESSTTTRSRAADQPRTRGSRLARSDPRLTNGQGQGRGGPSRPRIPSAKKPEAPPSRPPPHSAGSDRPQNRRRARTQLKPTPTTSDVSETTSAKTTLLRAQVQAKSSKIQSTTGKR